MKKVYLFTLLSIGVFSINAQSVNESLIEENVSAMNSERPVDGQSENARSVVVWESSFDTISEWVIGHESGAANLNWQLGQVPCAGSYPIDDIQSTSANDGWAIIDSDAFGGGQFGLEEDSWLTMAQPVNLTNYQNVVVEFETFYRRSTNERPFLVVGIGDGFGNVTWPNLNTMTDVSTMPYVYDVFPQFPNGATTNNPERVRINISDVAGGEQEVFIRLNWTGSWGYAWFVDDFRIVEQPTHDVELLKSWISGENNEGTQYGRYPETQMDVNWKVGAKVANYGINDQTNIVLEADFSSFLISDNEDTLFANQWFSMESIEALQLPIGQYSGNYTITSTQDTTWGPEFGNNTQERNFEVTADQYSLDVVGVYPDNELSLAAFGTQSFVDNLDGITLASWYHIKTQAWVESFEVLLGPDCLPGAEIQAKLIDTSAFWSTSSPDAGGFANSLLYTITADDITDGKATIHFQSPVLLSPGCYYAGVELFSHAGVHPVTIVDDRTVSQPERASATFLGGSSAINVLETGNAFGIRMNLFSQPASLNETIASTEIMVFPNPSLGIVHVSSPFGGEMEIRVTDSFGRLVHEENVKGYLKLNLKGKGEGVYFVHVQTEDKRLLEKIIIH